jgi:hypothetical protein
VRLPQKPVPIWSLFASFLPEFYTFLGFSIRQYPVGQYHTRSYRVRQVTGPSSSPAKRASVATRKCRVTGARMMGTGTTGGNG